MSKFKKIDVNDIVPFIVFFSIAIIFGIATRMRIFSASNLNDVFNQSVITLIVGLGMVCVASMGATDISCGSLIAVVSAVTCMAAGKAGGFVMFPLALIIGACSGLFVGMINARFKVSSFMVTLSLLIAYRAFSNFLLRSNEYFIPDSMLFIDKAGFKSIAVIFLVLAVGYVLMYTPFGFYLRAVGENENAMINMGLNTIKIKTTAFMISGMMAGIAAVFTMARVGGTQTTIGLGMDMRVMIAMYLCGIPVHGGFKAKIHKLLIGVPTVMLLDKGLVLCGLSGGTIQLIKGIVLVAAVITSNFIAERVDS